MASTGAARISSSNRREQILDVAMAFFARQGFEGTTTREIAEAGRVNEAIIFRHFPTKEDLYWAIIERKCQTSSRWRVIQQEIAIGGDDHQVFSAIAESILRRKREDKHITRLLWFAALERHQLSQEFFRKYVAECYEALAEHIRVRIGQGGFRRVDPLLAARGFLGMVVYHYLIQELFGGKKFQDFDPKHVADTLTDIWLRGMSTVAEKTVPKNGAASSASKGASKNGAAKPANSAHRAKVKKLVSAAQIESKN
jgi:AcrR family transcriptional regulator